jgi:hypothetical protein
MTPKQKARELRDKFYMAIPGDEMGKCYESSKQCALIAVNEILNEPDSSEVYWQQVKQEIEKL